MKNLIDSFVSVRHWSSAGSFEFNTDILATNPINLSVVLGVLIFFGKGVLNDLLDKRKQRILSTIRNSEELRRGAIEQLERARVRLRKVEIEADEYRTNGYSEIEREKVNLINATCNSLERLENYKNETLFFEKQRAINQVRQQVLQQALQRALGTLNSCLNSELHFRAISANIGILGSVEEITD
uniref:ATP synthase subunit b, chloroplastic n=1 Tax=Dendrobium primulinum TaxID=169180 RepID=A0A1Y1D8Z9_DENPR|nr:ATP synthase CF0 B chain [Dendrobium primulinum]BAX88201.1 ATP synthase CF0 B chain [Dendrobium primulinum]BBM29070.1 ATP synthase CF0 B chain [Dendrobium primulinum]BBM30772.1 ATP synthase CF0 B chain [Dendrobium primulinum]BCX71455.1 ATP synthase CF0 B chain [Dendrobium primulinum]